MTEVAEAGVPVEPSRPMRRAEMAAAEATTHVTATHVASPEATATAPVAASCRDLDLADVVLRSGRSSMTRSSLGTSSTPVKICPGLYSADLPRIAPQTLSFAGM
jgi:hypothetical protein